MLRKCLHTQEITDSRLCSQYQVKGDYMNIQAPLWEL